MDSLLQKTEQVLQKSDSKLQPILNNKIALAAIVTVLALNVINTFNLESMVTGTNYVGTIVPEVIKPYLYHKLVKYVSLFLTLLFVTKDIKRSVLITVALLIIMHLFFNENFDTFDITSNVHPGCVDLTVKDLLALFDNDIDALKREMYRVSVPLNLTLSDTNAPLIGTYFINHGKKVTDSCRLPM